MALQNLRTYFKETNINDFTLMLELSCVVSEKIQASSFHVKKTNTGFEHFKSGSKHSMDRVDRTMVKYYENGIKYFGTILSEVTEDMPLDWKFGFDYMIDNKTVDIEYDTLPKNNLILTHIQVLNPNDPTQIKKVIRDPQVLNKWADLLGVQRPPIVFQGKLQSNQKEDLLNLLSISDSDFSMKYKDQSFTRSIYNIFNNGLNNPALNSTLDNDIDGLIVNFYEGKNIKSFKLERFDRLPQEPRKPSDMYQLSILDLVEFIYGLDLQSFQLESEEPDVRYIELISFIFNAYVEKNATKYVGANFGSADFSDNKGFDLNAAFISNERTLSLIQNDVLSELFKITLGSFRKRRNKETEIINSDLMSQINEIVDKIEAIVMSQTNESDVMNFKSYLLNQKLAYAESPVLEALKVDYPEQGTKLVNMFVGRFQPFTLGHVKVVEAIHKQNGYPVVIFLVKSKTKKKEDAFKRPYDEDTQVAMIKSLKSKYPIEEVFVIPTGGIDTMFNAMRPKYEPVLWGTGSDRMKTYGFQVNKDTYREDLGVRPDFGLYEIPRTDNNISATQVRNAMLDGDEKLFKKLTPTPLHKMYKELKSKLEDSMGVLAESDEVTLTFDQFIKNI
jgi:cytidyltransferase-like protein